MKLRRVTSLTALVSFVLLMITSVVLYIVPTGRVAHWADWQLLWLSKSQWEDLHLNLGILFLLSIFLHIYYNWQPITAYLKDRLGRLRVFNGNFCLALLISLVVGVGTYLEVPPFVNIIQLSDTFKERAEEKYGEPPYGHAELSTLAEFASRLRYDLPQVKEALRKGGMEFDDEQQTVLAIAQANRVSPQQLFQLIKAEVVSDRDGSPGPPRRGQAAE
ncbi:DUF4405 domain-containing protein [Desulfurivibrio alkaliphilus]|uniref:Flavinylation-associated cytochrome domain-containing protein n=1 Tax=Desulfurivibrio alkaliphilus (strain DSM 19089 / UNIQEM U267 / AHT2) TaxID=589865 RepID=D6Z5B1_DESAT|nr:DUF4405 domain-containing protein [Desulfurivibrio alkaliphilus]ADH84768.1 conserved hypothetical protein [Desulfurivibrio alkaliphilus AHT 2]